MEKINIIKAVPNFPFLESTIDGLSYYQLLAGLNNYINSVVDTMNKLQSELDSIGGNKDIIDKIQNDITEIKTDIDNINNIISIIGSSPLTTDSKELTSAINEINGNVLSIESTVGNDNITTVSKTLIGAINELNNDIKGLTKTVENVKTSKILIINIGNISFNSNTEYKDLNLKTLDTAHNWDTYSDVDILGMDAWTNGIGVLCIWQYGKLQFYLTCDRKTNFTNLRIRIRVWY